MQNLQLDLTETFCEKEKEVYELLCANFSNEEIAEYLEISVSGIRWYLKNIYRKLGVNSTNKSEVQLCRQRAIAYTSTRVEEVYTREIVGFTEDDIRKASMRLTWHPNIREVMSDLFLVLHKRL